jgi:predicted DNA-binding protein
MEENEKDLRQISVRFTQEQVEFLEKLAAKENRTRSNLVKHIVEMYKQEYEAGEK